MPGLEEALSSMNERQRMAAVHGEGPMLVLAGPGSGKTYTITNRISYLIQRLGVAPQHILVITFTKEAALSMQRRFMDAQSGVQPVSFGTFHAVFYQILRQSLPRMGGILKDSEKKQLIFPVLRQCSVFGQGQEDLQDAASACLAAISYYKNTADAAKSRLLLPQGCQDCFEQVLEGYEAARKRSGKLDFDDMLYGCLKLLSSDLVLLGRLQERFRFLLIDEFQDINPMQYEVVRLLAGKRANVFAVGDDDQSIYGFRGSDPSLMRKFLEDYPGCRQILLNMNFRSRPEIVEASLAVIGENKERFPKDLKAFRPSAHKEAGCKEGGSYVTLRSFTDRNEEYRYLVGRLRDAPSLGAYAVLFRTNAQMQGFATLLAGAGVPYVMKERASCIYDHFIARDLDDFIRFAQGDRTRRRFLSIMNKPSRFLGAEAVPEGMVDFEAIREYYRQFAPPGLRMRVLPQLDRLEEGLLKLGRYKPCLGVQFIRKGLGYEKYLRKKAGGEEGRLMEWMEVLEFLTKEAARYQSYDLWQEDQERVREEMEHSPKKEEPKEGVRLMTAHASKGLEFPHVFLPDVNEGVYPHSASLDEKAVEEERRMLYVAMTRAKETLELSFVTGSKERPRLPSRFLNPLYSSISSNSQLSRYSSKASATASYSSSSSM